MESIKPETTSEDLTTLPGDIRTYEETAKMHYRPPYIFELTDEGRALYYYGTRHCHNPEDPLFENLEHQFNTRKPDVLFIEGTSAYNFNKENREKRFLEMDRTQLIRDCGESGFMITLAAKTSTEYTCPEPDYSFEINEVLRSGFSQEDIFAYYMYRTIDQYRRIPAPENTVEEYVQKYIDNFKKNTNWEGFDYSIKNLKAIGQRIWGENGDFEAGNFRVDPMPWDSKKESWTIVNEVCQASAEIREKFIFKAIAKEILKGKNVFVVYGSTHAVRQEPGLRRVFSLLSQKL